jgi:predicted nuclease with TOPRIM domain
MDLLAGDKQVRLLQKEVGRLEEENQRIRGMVEDHNDHLQRLRENESPKFNVQEKMRDLLRLCHPDRHNNSDKAADITRWLLQIREDARA